MSKCQEILTPLQIVKLLVWVEEHTDVLESVCPGWGSERMTQSLAIATATNSNGGLTSSTTSETAPGAIVKAGEEETAMNVETRTTNNDSPMLVSQQQQQQQQQQQHFSGPQGPT